MRKIKNLNASKTIKLKLAPSLTLLSLVINLINAQLVCQLLRFLPFVYFENGARFEFIVSFRDSILCFLVNNKSVLKHFS